MAQLTPKQENGIEFITSVMGEAFGSAFRGGAMSDKFGSPITRMAAEFAFGDAWQHEGLSRKEKSIANISALITLRQPSELKNHVKIGIANGLIPGEIEGILVQLTPYLGFPTIATALTACIEAMREAGVSADGVETAEERGLL